MEFNFTKSQLEIIQKLVEYPDDFKYPVGTIIASDDIHAVDNIGGQWDQIEDRFLLGAGSTFAVNSTGGEINHKLTVDEMPSHNHAFMSAGKGGSYTDAYKQLWSDTGGSDGNGKPANLSLPTFQGSQGVQNTGGDQPHNNMPPYMAKYMWIKTKLQSELEGENV